MRTTVDLSSDLHGRVRNLARQQNRSFSEVIADLIRRGLQLEPSPSRRSALGLPRLAVGRPITADDVRDLEDPN